MALMLKCQTVTYLLFSINWDYFINKKEAKEINLFKKFHDKYNQYFDYNFIIDIIVNSTIYIFS